MGAASGHLVPDALDGFGAGLDALGGATAATAGAAAFGGRQSCAR